MPLEIKNFQSSVIMNFDFRFAFRIYDIDNDGYISNGELFQVNISPIPNKEICIVTFIDSGVEDDGRQ